VRILHAILSNGFYGSERYCIDLAIAQARAGHDVTVLVGDESSVCAQQFRNAIAQGYGDGTQSDAVRLIAMPRSVPAWLQRPAAAILLAFYRPDVVHSHLNPAARRIGAIAQWLRIPHVLTLHLDYDPREHASIDGLVCLSAKQREQIPPGFAGEIETALARVDISEARQLRTAWRAGDDAVVFGSVGRLMPEKGMDVLVRAFRIAFTASNAAVRLVIVGDGPQRQELERLAGGDDRIVLAGPAAEVAPYYRAFDVFVSAARHEPFGLAILEGMAAGCPVVATRTEGPAEFLQDPRALWAAPDHAGELAMQLLKAAGHGRVRFGYDMSRFTLARATREIEAFYQRVARVRGRLRGLARGTTAASS
jgi:glycosyltransferase involved in cell wall biosynthesis